METFFSPVDLPAHLSYIVIAISYFLTDIFWLRVAAVVGLTLEIIYFNLSGTSLRTGLPWDAAFIAINVYQIFQLFREKMKARLPPEDAEMLRKAFDGLDDVQISKLLRASEWKNFVPGDEITRQDAPVNALYYICSGRAQVDVDGKHVATLETGSFIGEIAYLTGNTATADVTITEPSRLLSFSRMRMAKVTASDKQISGILYQVLGRDLAAKMRQANTRKVFEAETFKI